MTFNAKCISSKQAETGLHTITFEVGENDQQTELRNFPDADFEVGETYAISVEPQKERA
jgi:hypothetical protein